MITGGKLLCREQNLTRGEVTHFMGCRTLDEVKEELEKVRRKWADVDDMEEPIVVYDIAGDAEGCYVFTPSDLMRYMEYEGILYKAEEVYAELLNRVRLSYCEDEDRSDYYSVLELYMDLSDILEA